MGTKFALLCITFLILPTAHADRTVHVPLQPPLGPAQVYTAHLVLSNTSAVNQQVTVTFEAKGNDTCVKKTNNDPPSSQFTFSNSFGGQKYGSATTTSTINSGHLQVYLLDFDTRAAGSINVENGVLLTITVSGNAGFILADLYAEGSATRHSISVNGNRPF